MGLLCSLPCFGQGLTEFNAANASNGSVVAGQQTALSNSWYGFRTGSNGNSSTAINSAGAVEIGANNASNGALTIVSQASSLCGALPATDAGGSQAKLVDYNTSVGGGTQNVYMDFQLPSMSGTQVSWARDLVCISAVFSTSGTVDDETLTGTGASAFSNLINPSISGHMAYRLEGSCGQNGWPAGDCNVSIPVGTWVRIWRYFQFEGACSGTIVTITDAVNAGCIIIAATSPDNSTFYGFAYKSTGGTPGVGCSSGCQPTGWEWGDLNGDATSAAHIQHTDLEQCTSSASTTCTRQQFLNAILNPIPRSNGIVAYPRAADYTQAGFPGDSLPDAGWTQCGSTLMAGSYSGATITSNMSGCGGSSTPQYYLFGSGTFTISGCPTLPTAGYFAMRGQSDGSTHWVYSGSNCGSNWVTMASSDGTFLGQPPPNTCTISAGLFQGSTSITLSNLAGNCPTAIVTGTSPTIIAIDACDTGFSGVACGTGTSSDNSQDFRCSTQYSSPNGCAADPGEPGRPNRNTREFHTCSAFNSGTGVCTLSAPIISADLANLNNPQAVIFQSATELGVEYIQFNASNANAPSNVFDMLSCYKCWIYGVATTNTKVTSILLQQTTNGIVESNYLYASTNSCPSCYGIRPSYVGNMLIANNIIQQVGSPIFDDGTSVGDVYFANYCVGASLAISIIGGANLADCYNEHAGNYYNLYDQNVGNQISCDDIHGTCDHITEFRNFVTGWDSYPTTPIINFTNAREHFSFARYFNHIANVGGTPGYHTNYKGTNQGSSYVFTYGNNAGGVTTSDSLALSTSQLWGEYNVVNAALRWCGNSLDTNWSSAGNCNSTSESPTGASTYPNGVPVYGDTAIGEDVMPASFAYSSRPSWWAASIPYPAIGPDVSGGNVGQCSGTLNTAGQFNGTPALTNAQCGSHGITASAWGGHVNAIPAMAAYLNTMSGPPDGSGSVLSFNPSMYNSGQASPATCSPTSGTVPQTVTCTNPNSGTTVACYRVNATPATAGDGVNCASGSTKYTTSLSISVAETLNIVAGTSTLTDSSVNSYTYSAASVIPSAVIQNAVTLSNGAQIQ